MCVLIHQSEEDMLHFYRVFFFCKGKSTHTFEKGSSNEHIIGYITFQAGLLE